MTTRQFDPVFSAALRNELEALADAPQSVETTHRGVLTTLRRPQVWISLVTAVVLAIATIGVLHLTGADRSDPAARSKVVDPLRWITDPSSSGYVAREVQVLLHVRASGPGAHEISVPAGVRQVQIYLNCAPSGHSGIGFDGDGKVSGDCSRSSGASYGVPVAAGTHEVQVAIGKRTAYTLLITAAPAPTVSPGALLDPLSAVRDLRNPDALVGSTTPVLRSEGAGSGATTSVAATPGKRLRLYFVCQGTSASSSVSIDGHTVDGCMNSIAHWFDFTPTDRVLTATVHSAASERWSLLVVPAPPGAKDSPANTTLPYPRTSGTRLAEARGSGAAASGTYRRPGTAIVFSVTCRGTGWLEISTGDGGTNTRQSPCSTLDPQTIGFGGEKDTKAQPWTVIPHGDISWTFQLTSDD